MTGDCQLTLTSGGTSGLTLAAGNLPGSNPTQALSDVTAILSSTTPNNEHCNFPYTYTPGNWQMYFCRRNSNNTYTCPTTSGRPGQCVPGKFATIRASGTGGFDQTYGTDVKQSTSTTQCLDFYYYIPGTPNNPKIQVGWKAGENTQQIIELTPLPENKWYNSRGSFTAPSSSSYQVILLLILTLCYSQNLSYQCNFDNDMTGDCQFTLTPDGTSNLALTIGNFPPGMNPTHPLSDVTAVLSLTTPNNEHCDFPYNYSLGNWPMYFCQRHFNNSYTCPTTSGRPGLCATGKFANIQASGSSGFDQTYVTDIKQSTSTTQCLDFYYYIPGTSNNPKIQVGWKADEDTQQIIELISLPENKWHNSRSNFAAPSSSSYQVRNWPMYFCQRHFNNSYTCPTTSGRPGLCATGKFANIQASGSSGFDQTYVTDVKQSTSTTQCLDFYYYIPGTSNNPKIQVGWKAGEDTQQIIELTPLPENKWHSNPSSFIAPLSSSYQVSNTVVPYA
ncbi:unnamed protein product [Rotaria sp. Silwood1]|nr:unnamed protein product [Rotaria sp. Silwood1]